MFFFIIFFCLAEQFGTRFVLTKVRTYPEGWDARIFID